MWMEKFLVFTLVVDDNDSNNNDDDHDDNSEVIYIEIKCFH